ncbi:hypothetical protein HUJ04_004707 [Dendroctonus ponderosae]
MFTKFKDDTTFIPKLEELLKPTLHGKIVKQEVTPLTSFGENFGSEILKVDVTVEENGKQRQVHGVGKLIPSSEVQLEIFNTQVTFKNEIGFYADIVPAMQEFQREHGVAPTEYFPEMYGARISLDPQSKAVDLNAILLLENLKVKGFFTVDKYKGFDVDSTKTVLRALANFQATTVALRKKKPDVFSSKVQPYLAEWTAPAFPEPLNVEPILKENPNTAYLAIKAQNAISKKRIKKIREPWACVTHNDLWVNNVMVRESNGMIHDIKFVDFQVIDYASPVCDLIFFLFSSVPNSVLRYHFDKLLQYYYKEFINTLSLYKVNTKEFSFESFEEELRLEGCYQVNHSIFMLFPILGSPEPPKPIGKVPQWDPNNEAGASNGDADKKPAPGGIPQTFNLPMKEKVWYIVEEAAKHNWI